MWYLHMSVDNWNRLKLYFPKSNRVANTKHEEYQLATTTITRKMSV